MKTLHIIFGLNSAGAENFLQRFVQEGHKQGDSHTVLNLGKSTKVSENLQKYCSVINLDIKNRFLIGVFKLFYIKLFKTKDMDLIYGWMYYGNILAYLFSIGVTAKCVANIRHTPVLYSNETLKIKFSLLLNRLVSKRFSRIIFNSEHSKQWHIKYGFCERICDVITNGYRQCKILDERRRDDIFVLGVAARYHPMKNYSDVLKVFDLLIEHNIKIKLIIVGSHTDEIKKEFLYKRHKRNILIEGECFDMESFYQRIDLLISFSLWGESFQNVVAESMMYGIPALSSDIGAAKDIVLDQSYLIPVGDYNSLLDRILIEVEKSKDNNLWKEIRTNCHKKIVDNFSIERVYDDFQNNKGEY
jgi:glycosyltransferase involved in cell wall biosynthesis